MRPGGRRRPSKPRVGDVGAAVADPRDTFKLFRPRSRWSSPPSEGTFEPGSKPFRSESIPGQTRLGLGKRPQDPPTGEVASGPRIYRPWSKSGSCWLHRRAFSWRARRCLGRCFVRVARPQRSHVRRMEGGKGTCLGDETCEGEARGSRRSCRPSSRTCRNRTPRTWP